MARYGHEGTGGVCARRGMIGGSLLSKRGKEKKNKTGTVERLTGGDGLAVRG